MLEHPGLLLGPWQPTPAGAASPASLTRLVIDPVSRARLGIVRRRARPRWLGREALEVYETDDESLLCTVRAPWWLSWSWEVYDADDRRVATIRGTLLRDAMGRSLAALQPAETEHAQKLVTGAGVELGEVNVSVEETLVQFAPALANEPLARMAFLGMVLSNFNL
jgi:hypothetical protein